MIVAILLANIVLMTIFPIVRFMPEVPIIVPVILFFCSMVMYYEAHLEYKDIMERLNKLEGDRDGEV